MSFYITGREEAASWFSCSFGCFSAFFFFFCHDADVDDQYQYQGFSSLWDRGAGRAPWKSSASPSLSWTFTGFFGSYTSFAIIFHLF
jgi:hypothetical protein